MASQRSIFLRTCWLPAGLWILTLFSLRRYDGWGAWAAAPLLLPAFGLSIAGVVLGAGLLVSAWRDGRFDTVVALATGVSGIVAGFYVLRYLLM